MTDYEFLSVFMASVETLWIVFSTFVSIVFAFLVVSYLVAARLDAPLAAIVMTLYTLVMLWATWALSRASASVTAIAGEIKASVQQGSTSLGWHPAANTPDLVAAAIPTVITSIAVLTYIGSIFFFYLQRRQLRT
jgi:hypothetical protein